MTRPAATPERRLCISYSRTVFSSEPEAEQYREEYGWITGGVGGDELPLPPPGGVGNPHEKVYTEILRAGESEESSAWGGEKLSLGGVIRFIREAREEGYGLELYCPEGSPKDGSDYYKLESLFESDKHNETMDILVHVDGLDAWEIAILIPLVENRWHAIPDELD